MHELGVRSYRSLSRCIVHFKSRSGPRVQHILLTRRIPSLEPQPSSRKKRNLSVSALAHLRRSRIPLRECLWNEFSERKSESQVSRVPEYSQMNRRAIGASH